MSINRGVIIIERAREHALVHGPLHPVQFCFHLVPRSPRGRCHMAAENYREVRARRKEAFQHDRIMFPVPRTYCEEEDAGRGRACTHVKAGTRCDDEGTCPIFPRGASSAVASLWKHRKRVSIVSHLDVHERTQSDTVFSGG